MYSWTVTVISNDKPHSVKHVHAVSLLAAMLAVDERIARQDVPKSIRGDLDAVAVSAEMEE